MKRTQLVLGAAALLLVAHVAVSQRDFSNVEFKTTHVAGTVYVLNSGAGGNIGVSVGDDGILMIDDQFAPLAPKIRAAIAKLAEGTPKFLINTHHHGDHTGGNAEFGTEATIIAQTNVRKRLADQPAAALPIVTFPNSMTLYFNGEEIELTYLPAGHTDGDTAVYFKQSNVIHMGDDFFAGGFPFVDLSSGGTVDGYLKNVGKVIASVPDDVKIIPGHGELSTLADLKTFHNMLQETVSHVRGQMDAGKSLAEIQEAGLPDKWDGWGEGFINESRWIETIYNSYKT